MEKIVSYILLAIFVLPASLYSQVPSTALTFEERVHNFGTILEEKGKVSHTFVFQNKGKSPVSIDEVNSACGCIGKVVSQGSVKPGGKGKITITFDPGYKSGFFSKEIVVLSNGKQNYNRIWVEGIITPGEHPVEEGYPYNFGNGLFLRLKVVSFVVTPGETRQMELHYANATDKEMTLDFVTTGSEKGLAFTNPGKIKPKARGKMTFSYTMPKSRKSNALFKLNPYVNKKKISEILEVRILNEQALKPK